MAFEDMRLRERSSVSGFGFEVLVFGNRFLKLRWLALKFVKR